MTSVMLLWSLLILTPPSLADSPCLTRRGSDPSSSQGVTCVFPFTYQGKTHNACTIEGEAEGRSWCSTKVDNRGQHVTGGGNWGVCGIGCPQEPICPSSWVRLGVGCYKFPGPDEGGMTMPAAQSFCEEKGGYLLEVGSESESRLLKDYYESSRHGYCVYEAAAFWLGVYNNSLPGQGDGEWVRFRDQLPVEYTRWYGHEPSYIEGKDKCAAVMADKFLANTKSVENFRWVDLPCDTDKIAFREQYNVKLQPVCERDVENVVVVDPVVEEWPQLELSSNGCLKGWSKLATGCYLFKPQPSTWHEARLSCDRSGGYLVEINTEEEFSALEQEWSLLNRSCENNKQSWWLGLTDRQSEGTWMWDFSGAQIQYEAWQYGEPNNHGGQVPGEDCVMASLGYVVYPETFKWFDIHCDIRSFPVRQGVGVTINPLCEQYSKNILTERMDASSSKLDGNSSRHHLCAGCEKNWVDVGGSMYKFVKIPEGTTRDEAEEICRNNGGHIAEPSTVEEMSALRKYYKQNIEDEESTSSFLSTIASWFISYTEIKYGWWIGASDEKKEGQWHWRNSGMNVTADKWVFSKSKINNTSNEWVRRFASPNNENWMSYGSADCAAIISNNDDIHVDDGPTGEGKKLNEQWEKELEDKDDFKWFSVSCYAKKLHIFNIRLSPLCQL